MTKSQTALINQARVLAMNARRELGTGADPRPTVDALNTTLTRLGKIVNILESV